MMNIIRGLGSTEKACDEHLIKLAEAIDPAADLISEPEIIDCMIENSFSTRITIVNHTAYKLNILTLKAFCKHLFGGIEDEIQIAEFPEEEANQLILTVDEGCSPIVFTNDDCQVIAYHLKANNKIILIENKDQDKNAAGERIYLSRRTRVMPGMDPWEQLEASSEKCHQAFMNARKEIAFRLLWAAKKDTGSSMYKLWVANSDVFNEVIKTYIFLERI